MQQPLAYVVQTLFQHEVFVIAPTLNAGSKWRHVSHDNTTTIIVFLICCTNLQKNDEHLNTFKYRIINF